MSKHRSSEEIKREIASTRERVARLREEERTLSGRLQVIKKELAELAGNGFRRWSKLDSLEGELKKAEIIEHRATCRKVVFEPSGRTWVKPDPDSVVTRVTKKRIYYAAAGTANPESFVGLDGKPETPYGHGHSIDVEKTFGKDWDQKTP